MWQMTYAQLDCLAVIGEKVFIWSTFFRTVIPLNAGASEETKMAQALMKSTNLQFFLKYF